MPLQQTSGAASYDAFGGGVPVAAKYIEDFFQTWLRTGTGASATVTTGLNGAINETMVWTKSRSAATNHKLTDNVRGATKALSSNTTAAEVTDSQGLTAFSSTGYTIGTNTDYNNSGATYVDWQWVATPKFFDVVTYTGTGNGNNVTVNHALESTPGFIITKAVSSTSDWTSWHRSASFMLQLNRTDAASSTINNFAGFIDNVTSTSFRVNAGSSANDINQSGVQYVAYLFAHNAGGFGLTGTDNVISCGSFVGNGSTAPGVAVDLGYEPQFVLFKRVNDIGAWSLVDTMRGLTVDGVSRYLYPNLSAAETAENTSRITNTGFRVFAGNNGDTFIYIAIRRGPMKVPTDGTSVFAPVATSAATGTKLTTNFPVDLQIFSLRSGTTNKNQTADRLRGVSTNATEGGSQLITSSTAAETTNSIPTLFWDNTGFQMPSSYGGTSEIFWNFRRAPGFFDEVCYTGTGVATTVSHNLGVAPELMIVKRRNLSSAWLVYTAALGATKSLFLEQNSGPNTSSLFWNDTAPTPSVFTVGTIASANNSGDTYVAHLFATCPGVSKVFSYTGNGTSQTINCGFTGGARFVLLKASSATGGWYVYDTARGMTVLTDPYLQLNSTAAETATLGSVTTVSTGFAVNEAITTGVNTSGVTYIGLAIA